MPNDSTPPSECRLADQCVIVTGAGQGIGKEIAKKVASAGARVICVDVNKDSVEQTSQELGNEATFHFTDVSNVDQVEGMFKRLKATRITGLCNVAGIAGPQQTAHLTTSADWDRTVAVNLRGTYLMTRGAIPALNESRGSIVNIASALAHIGWRREASYGPTKAAVVQFTKSLALDYAPRIRANSISPGAVRTPMIEAVLDETDADAAEYGSIHPLTSRLIPASAVADACVFLLSTDADFITGIDLPVDAGMLAIGRSAQDMS